MDRLLIELIDCLCRCLARTGADEVNWTEELYADWLVGLLQTFSFYFFPPHYTLHIPAAIGYASIFTIGTRLAMRKYMYITMCVIYDNLEAHEHRYNKGNARLG